jgi:hypothetical protein
MNHPLLTIDTSFHKCISIAASTSCSGSDPIIITNLRPPSRCEGSPFMHHIPPYTASSPVLFFSASPNTINLVGPTHLESSKSHSKSTSSPSTKFLFPAIFHSLILFHSLSVGTRMPFPQRHIKNEPIRNAGKGKNQIAIEKQIFARACRTQRTQTPVCKSRLFRVLLVGSM